MSSKKYKIIDLFAGTGAFSNSFINIDNTKYECVFANDFDKNSEKIYKLNHSSINFSVEDLNKIKIGNIPEHDILCGGFPCFVEGTLVLTNNGYKCIENVNYNDKLLTHSGKFQNIINLQKKYYSNFLYEITINFNYETITSTYEHPYYVIEKKCISDKEVFGKPIWKKACELTNNDYFGMVINSNNNIPEFTFEMNNTIKLDNLEYWFFLGYYWNNKNDCEDDKKYIFNILKEFNNNIIPEWIQDAPKEFIREFINGYVKVHGKVYENNILTLTTTSYNIAYGLQRLYLKLGDIFHVYKKDDYFIIELEFSCKDRNLAFIEDNYVWYSPSKITKRETKDRLVYNFEVEDDNSYIVQNIIVHNCQPFSIAGEKKGFEDARSNVFWKLCEIIENKKPEILILENVKNLTSHDNGNTYKTIESNLKKLGYHIKSSILDTSKITHIPQHRERIYIVCFLDKSKYDKFDFKFDTIENKQIKLFLEDNVDNKYYYTNKLKVYDEIKKEVKKHINENILYQYRRYYVRENKSNCCPTLTANMGSGGHNVPLLLDDNGIRKLTPRECFNLQGFPTSYKLPDLSDSALYKLAGNSVTVPVIELIIKKINDLI